MNPVGLKVVSNPDVAKLFSDPIRRQILHLLTHKEMSAADLVKETGKNYSSIVYNLKLLEDAELIANVREEIVQKKVQVFYRAAAWSFHVSYYLNEAMLDDDEYQAWQNDLNNRLVDGLKGFSFTVSDENRERALELMRILYLHQKKEYEDRVSIRDSEVQFDPHVGRYLSHIVADMRLISDNVYKEALEELKTLVE
jgi:DNA-binding transcriptional ArsR family regulator